jgi:hypothetical protein
MLQQTTETAEIVLLAFDGLVIASDSEGRLRRLRPVPIRESFSTLYVCEQWIFKYNRPTQTLTQYDLAGHKLRTIENISVLGPPTRWHDCFFVPCRRGIAVYDNKENWLRTIGNMFTTHLAILNDEVYAAVRDPNYALTLVVYAWDGTFHRARAIAPGPFPALSYLFATTNGVVFGLARPSIVRRLRVDLTDECEFRLPQDSFASFAASGDQLFALDHANTVHVYNLASAAINMRIIPVPIAREKKEKG